MSQDCTKIFVLSIRIQTAGLKDFKGGNLLFQILIPRVDAGAGECRPRTIECYNCDSRTDPHCVVIDVNNPTSIKPYSKPCSGCCVKFLHKLDNGKSYIHRMCTEHIIINYFMVDHVCMSEGKQRGKMCFCEEHLCNISPPSKLINNFTSILGFLFLTAMLV